MIASYATRNSRRLSVLLRVSSASKLILVIINFMANLKLINFWCDLILKGVTKIKSYLKFNVQNISMPKITGCTVEHLNLRCPRVINGAPENGAFIKLLCGIHMSYK